MKNLMTSGIGQFHTNEPDPEKPDKQLTPYLAIGLVGIRTLVDNPQHCDKEQAQWLIPSTLPSRNFGKQEHEGEFWMIWGDLDNHPPTLLDLAEIVSELTGNADFELYNSRGATLENQKARLLIPLIKPLSGADWMLTQSILNDKLQARGIKPDRATERPAQLCYLPNRGAFYRSRSKRDGTYFDPMATWQAEITTQRDQLAAQRLALEAAKAGAKTRRESLTIVTDHSLDEVHAGLVLRYGERLIGVKPHPA